MVIEAFEHWLDTVYRHRVGIKTFDHWPVTVDRQRGGTNQSLVVRSSERDIEAFEPW